MAANLIRPALGFGAVLTVLAIAGAAIWPPPVVTESLRTPTVYAAQGRFSAVSRHPLTAADRRAASAVGLLPADVSTLLDLPATLRHGDYVWSDDGVAPGLLTIWVDLRRQMISVYRAHQEIGTAVIVYGAPQMGSPIGRFKILSKDRDYRSRSYDAPMPYSLFITTNGVALHGSPMSARHATHGCIGLPVAFARALFAAAVPGDVVHIVQSNAVVKTQSSQ